MLWTTVCGCFLFVVSGRDVGGATLYSATDLGAAINVRGLNDKGEVLGTGDNGSFLYDGSSRYSLPAPPSGTFTGAGINNNGEIAGTILNPGSDYSLAVYSNGVYRSLVGSPNATATAVNDAGQIAGQQVRAYRASLYSGGTFTTIGVLPGDFESASSAIAPNGDVLAVSIGSSMHPVIFSNGTLTPVAGGIGFGGIRDQQRTASGGVRTYGKWGYCFGGGVVQRGPGTPFGGFAGVWDKRKFCKFH